MLQFGGFSCSQMDSLGQKIYCTLRGDRPMEAYRPMVFLQSYTPRKRRALKSLLGQNDGLEASIVHDHMHMFQSDMLVCLLVLHFNFNVHVPWSRKITYHVHVLGCYGHPPKCTFFGYGRVHSFGPRAK